VSNYWSRFDNIDHLLDEDSDSDNDYQSDTEDQDEDVEMLEEVEQQ